MKNVLYQIVVNISERFTGPILRNVGKKMYAVGTTIQGEYGSEDRLVPSLRNLSFEGVKPQLQQTDFVAPNATVFGNVKAGDKSSIWYGATLLGNQGIIIGDNCVIQDRVHISKKVSIGNNVFIGPNVTVQGSQIYNRAFIAMGATVKQATIQKGGFVAAGAVVQNDSIVKQGQVWAGNPARFLRLITPLERQVVSEHLEEMQELACIHSQQTQKPWQELINGEQWKNLMSFEQFAENFLDSNTVVSQTDEQFIEQRILLKQKLEYPEVARDYEPYIYDQSSFSSKFNVGVHDQEVKNIATKIKQKQSFENNRNQWTTKF